MKAVLSAGAALVFSIMKKNAITVYRKLFRERYESSMSAV